MSKRTFIVTLFAALLSVTLSAQQEVIDNILADTTLTGSSWSVCFADAVTGEVIFGHDADRNLASASVMKLYPTSVALSLLGPDYRYRTELYITGSLNQKRGILNGDIVILGGGDPALGSPYFTDHYGDVTAEWVAALRAAGIKRVKGRVAAARSLYDLNPLPDGWEWGDMGQYYGAGVYDININDNAYNIYITGGEEGVPAMIDSVQQYGRDISMINYLISSGRSDRGYVYNAPYSSTAWISGTVPVNHSFALRASLPDPPMALVRKLDADLRKAGIVIDGIPARERVILEGQECREAAHTLSPALTEIVKVTNHESVNMYAEALSRHLGYELRREGSYSAGRAVIADFLDSIGCDHRRSLLLDGSGLSSNNNISARLTVKLLVHMNNSPVADHFVSSLPEGNLSGTMKNYFRDEMFKGRVVAKTGTINSAKSFAGYFTTNSGRRVAFTTFANGFTVGSRVITDYMEEMVREIILSY